MKTETQIAEENIGWFIKNDKDDIMRGMCERHKASCQRFLEFLEEDVKSINAEIEIAEKHKAEPQIRVYKLWVMRNSQKITDLKQAIKLYEDNGI